MPILSTILTVIRNAIYTWRAKCWRPHVWTRCSLCLPGTTERKPYGRAAVLSAVARTAGLPVRGLLCGWLTWRRRSRTRLHASSATSIACAPSDFRLLGEICAYANQDTLRSRAANKAEFRTDSDAQSRQVLLLPRSKHARGIGLAHHISAGKATGAFTWSIAKSKLRFLLPLVQLHSHRCVQKGLTQLPGATEAGSRSNGSKTGAPRDDSSSSSWLHLVSSRACREAGRPA